MLQLSIMDQSGHSDVSVYTRMNTTTHAYQEWPSTARQLQGRDRNVASWPITLLNMDATEYIGPSPEESPEAFVKGPLGPILRGTLRIDVLRADDSIIRTKTTHIGLNLVRNGRARILPNETLHTNLAIGHAWFDKTGGDIPIGDKVWLFILFDPEGQLQTPTGETARCNIWGVPARFYVGQVRHSESVDIP